MINGVLYVLCNRLVEESDYQHTTELLVHKSLAVVDAL